MALIDELIEKARKAPKVVALPECENEDTLLAARRVADDGIGTPVLVSPADVIAQTAERAGVSILALVQTPGFAGPEGDVIALTDCGLNPEPTAEELASIAIAACDNVSAPMDWEPRCAFISYSTDGSGESESVERIRKAISIARDRRPDLALDGEFQLDAAIIPAVAAKKVKRESAVAGRANVLVFPDLNCANSAVKLIQIFAHGKGYGHNLSGFRRPVADSSRGSSVEEMVGDIAMLVLSAR